MHLILWLLPQRERVRIYATEQVTALFRWLKLNYPHSVGSEYLVTEHPGVK